MSILIFVVDDEPGVHALVKAYVESETLDVRIEEFRDGLAALKRLEHASSEEPALIFSDIEMPKMNGIELKRRLAALKPHIPVVIMSGMSTSQLRREFPDEADRVLGKPFTMTEFKEIITKNTKTATDMLMDRVMKHDLPVASELARGGGLRGLLDLSSNEAKHTTLEQKVELLRRIRKCNVPMFVIVDAVVEILVKQTYPLAEAERVVREGLSELLDHTMGR